MNEIERIESNINGELPEGIGYRYIIVENIKEPERALETYKQSMLMILKNKDLHEEDPKWEQLLPKEVVAFTNQLEEDDYRDELLSHIPNMVRRVLTIRDWEWYSSQLYEDGFEIIILGRDIGAIAYELLHHQGIPHSSLASGDDETIIRISRAGRDVLSYKTWNSDTLKLE
ncbi:hypothetical protein ACSIGC_11255 [Tenacibaculum sp. ZS6-P6]|uniref:hypothetical protein n=1 Tax=Tenacibaculum sp. ZS6-P6 TaxID=3447503 RepID=UPI003F95496E